MSAAPDMLVQLTTSQLKLLVKEAVREELGSREQGVVFLRLAQVATLLKCSEKSVLRRVKQGLPAAKLGVEWRFVESEVLDYMRKKGLR
jgi:excisionase family DNA binding protein